MHLFAEFYYWKKQKNTRLCQMSDIKRSVTQIMHSILSFLPYGIIRRTEIQLLLRKARAISNSPRVESENAERRNGIYWTVAKKTRAGTRSYRLCLKIIILIFQRTRCVNANTTRNIFRRQKLPAGYFRYRAIFAERHRGSLKGEP